MPAYKPSCQQLLLLAILIGSNLALYGTEEVQSPSPLQTGAGTVQAYYRALPPKRWEDLTAPYNINFQGMKPVVPVLRRKHGDTNHGMDQYISHPTLSTRTYLRKNVPKDSSTYIPAGKNETNLYAEDPTRAQPRYYLIGTHSSQSKEVQEKASFKSIVMQPYNGHINQESLHLPLLIEVDEVIYLYEKERKRIEDQLAEVVENKEKELKYAKKVADDNRKKLIQQQGARDSITAGHQRWTGVGIQTILFYSLFFFAGVMIGYWQDHHLRQKKGTTL